MSPSPVAVLVLVVVVVLMLVCWTVLVVMSVSRYGDMIMRHIWCYGETRGCCWYPPSVHDRPPGPPDTQHTISATMAFLSGSKKGPKEEARYRREVSFAASRYPPRTARSGQLETPYTCAQSEGDFQIGGLQLSRRACLKS